MKKQVLREIIIEELQKMQEAQSSKTLESFRDAYFNIAEGTRTIRDLLRNPQSQTELKNFFLHSSDLATITKAVAEMQKSLDKINFVGKKV